MKPTHYNLGGVAENTFDAFIFETDAFKSSILIGLNEFILAESIELIKKKKNT